MFDSGTDLDIVVIVMMCQTFLLVPIWLVMRKIFIADLFNIFRTVLLQCLTKKRNYMPINYRFVLDSVKFRVFPMCY